MPGMIRRMSLPLLLASGVIVPFVAVGETTRPIRDKVTSWFQGGGASEPSAAGAIQDPDVARLLAPTLQQTPSNQTAAGAVSPMADLREFLRFDITPRWVMDRWPHVSTTRADGPLDGLRVPLVTGTRVHDVAGSLTYYFDKAMQVQRIALSGVVGDERYLVSVVTEGFKLQPDHAAGTGMFVAKWNGKPTSALWIRRLPVVRADNPYQKFQFALELNRPNHHFGLSPEFHHLLVHSRAGEASVGTVR